MHKHLIPFIIGILIGFVFYDRFFKPETQTVTKYVETIKTEVDTVYVTEVVEKTKEKVITLYERDTILIDYKPKIKGFRRAFPLTYGNVSFEGEVLGELLKVGVVSDLKIPVVTNTITKEKTSTVVVQPSGLYFTGGINSNFSYSVGASYLRNKSIIGYEYQPQVDIHSLRVGWKIF